MKYKHLVHMPSAVEDWLEQQLEARGIDAVVYTRYILSLLQQETLDDPYDILFSSSSSPNKKKEGRRGRKRWRRETATWHTWDSESLKRLAAVQCLMSAADEKCGIEKLVDELCAKLKEIQSEGITDVELVTSQGTQLPVLDPASKYFAAFPPLSYEKKDMDNPTIAPPFSTSAWSRHLLLDAKLSNHTENNNDASLPNSNEIMLKENFSCLLYGKTTNDFGLEFTRDVAKYGEHQDGSLICFKDIEDDEPDRVLYHNQQNVIGNGKEIVTKRLYERNGSDEENSDYIDSELPSNDENLKGLISKFDHNIEALWNSDKTVEGINTDDSNSSSFGNSLLSAELPSFQNNVDHIPRNMLLNFDTNYIQYCNRMSNSIWSLECENSKNDSTFPPYKNMKKSTVLSVGNEKYEISNTQQIDQSGYKPYISDWNELSAVHYLPWGINNMVEHLTHLNDTLVNSKKWSNTSCDPVSEKSSMENIFGKISNDTRLSALNHNKEGSLFAEVYPKTVYNDTTKMNSDVVDQANPTVPEEEDLLTSAKTHFRPIRMEEGQTSKATVYADGTTFMIPNDLEKVSFKRSESGTLYLESDAELDAPKKYMEFKEKDSKTDSNSNSECVSLSEEFIPKFRVRQSNEKFCQTEDVEDEQIVPSIQQQEAEEYVANCNRKLFSDPDDFFFPGDDELADCIVHSDEEEESKETKPSTLISFPSLKLKSDLNYNEISEPLTTTVLELSSKKMSLEISTADSSECNCDGTWKNGWAKANPNTNTNVWKMKKNNENQQWHQIWNCSPQFEAPNTCKGCSKNFSMQNVKHDINSTIVSEKTKDQQYCQLRDELSEDGEQLMSDLSCFQQLYLSCDLFDDSEETSVSELLDDEAPNLDFLKLEDGEKLSIQDSCITEEPDPKAEEDICPVSDQFLSTDKGNYFTKWPFWTLYNNNSFPNWLGSDGSIKSKTWIKNNTHKIWKYNNNHNNNNRSNSPTLYEDEFNSKRSKGEENVAKSPFQRIVEENIKINEDDFLNERPFIAAAVQKDRKRRHSSSQKACKHYMEGQCRRPHCRFAHSDSMVPCPFFADASCMKGEACPLAHGTLTNNFLRPLTL